MESGDIIYFILLVFFAILGFFNDSRKKKQQKQWEAQNRPEVESRPFFDEEREVIPSQPQVRRRKVSLPPPVPAAYSGAEVHREFRSSIDLVSIHDEQSSRPGYSYDYDAGSYEKDPDSPDIADTYHGNSEEKVVKGSLHPLIRELREEAGREELKKGLIYGEIIQRKY